MFTKITQGKYLHYAHVSDAHSGEIRCLENGRFYRDPNRPTHKVWTATECSKYFLCLEGEVFKFQCSSGLLFDVNRQICDFKLNVDNCDITSGKNIQSISAVQCIFKT